MRSHLAMYWAAMRRRWLELDPERGDVPGWVLVTLMTAGLAAVLLPWNLPVWWQLRRLRLAIEVDCDARVVRRGGDLRQYASLLIEVGRRRAGGGSPLLALAGPASFLSTACRASRWPSTPSASSLNLTST